jgi:hypothetical protein
MAVLLQQLKHCLPYKHTILTACIHDAAMVEPVMGCAVMRVAGML